MASDNCKSSTDLHDSYNIYLIDPKGNLQAVKLSLDQQNFELKADRDETLQNSLSAISEVKDFLEKLKQFKFLGAEYNPSSSTPNAIKLRRNTATSTSSVSLSPRNPIKISIDEIQEIRLKCYDLKSNLVNAGELKKIKTIRAVSVKGRRNNLRLLQILFGNEFNLQCYQFLVIGIEQFSTEHGPPSSSKTCQLEIWVDHVMSLVTHEHKNVNYFELLDRCYKKEFAITEKSCNRLQIWHRFLQIHHHGLPIKRIQEYLSCLGNLLREHMESYETKPINSQEFVSIARYFTHSKECFDRIFDIAIKTVLPYSKYCENVSVEILDLFQSYCLYIMSVEDKYLPNIVSNLDTVIVTYGRKQIIKYLMEKFMKETKSPAQEKWMSPFYILDYIYSPQNSIWSPDKQQIYQDMTQPLSHYFIASSHNTYLTGNQYKSKSSCEAYARVLRQGCRCIEIDVWNGPKNKPTVKHGNTMTTAVKLKDVLTTIKEHSFVVSPYPVIISIENHCSIKQQKVMAKYFWRIFGKMLFTGTMTEESGDGTQLPSPEQLKYRILLKGRALPSQVPNECSSIKKEIRSGLKRLKSISDSTENRTSNTSGNSNVSSYVEPNSSEFLLVGELLMKNENKQWTPQMFLLNSKTMICIEEECSKRKSTRRSQLPSFPILRQSLSLAELAQEFHQEQMWFHGQIHGGYKEVNELLKNTAPGSFLVWESSSLPGNFVLSIFYPNTDILNDRTDPCDDFHHVPIESSIFTSETNCQSSQTLSEPKYYLYDSDSATKFNSIYELISHYQQQPFPTNTTNLKRLGTPVEVKLPNTHENMEWFFKDMDRPTSEKVLDKFRIDGLFLGRYKDEKHSEIVISFRCDNQTKHCSIKRDSRNLTISNLKFRKLEELVQYYGTTTFYKNVKLKHHLTKRLYDMVAQDKNVDETIYSISACSESSFNERTCTVRAIQKYDSSEPNILSFQKGDIIVNVIKDKGSWWSGAKADCPTERKQFCSSFVEEIYDFECPFEGYVGKLLWKLGVKASLKTCTDKSEKKDGISHYIIFEDENGGKRKLGTTCSIVAKEWVDTINVVIAQNEELNIKLFQARNSKRHKIATELSDLICLGNTRETETLESCVNAVDGIAASKRHANASNIFPVKSFSEWVAQCTFETDAMFWIRYHQESLTRIFPKGLRLNSSNFNPMTYWSFGSQLVSLNYQTPDKGMQINRGMFQQNGNCGYVLKPKVLLDRSNDEFVFCPIDSTQIKHVFTIEVVGARHLRKETSGQISPFVEIEIIGVDKDCQKSKTSRKETGLNPYWNEEFHFQIDYPELALVQFRVYEEDSFSDKIFLGESTIPVSCIRHGFRSIQLNNEFGAKLFSRLFVRVTLKSL